MSRKRTAHDMRMIAKNRLGDYFARLVDELFFMYLSGARGINQDFIEGTDFTGFARNRSMHRTHRTSSTAAPPRARHR